MIYYSTGKSPYLPNRGEAVETNNHTTAEILLEKGSIVKSKEELLEKVIYLDKSGKEYTEEEVLAMDKRTALYKEIMELKNK